MSRRQEFLTEVRYNDFLAYSDETKEFWANNTFESDTPEQEASLRVTHFKNVALKKLFISYTAGLEITSLVPLLEELITHYENRQEKLSLSENIVNISPLAIDDWLDEYEECIQVISLCILLRRTDLLKRFVELFDEAGYDGQDALHEDLLCKVLPDREDIDDWYHEVYTPLLQAIYADEKYEASDLLAEYCKEWYPAFKQAPWHDSHLQGDEGSYVGYWAFEAGAVAFLYGIDDRKINHMVYPKILLNTHEPILLQIKITLSTALKRANLVAKQVFGLRQPRKTLGDTFNRVKFFLTSPTPAGAIHSGIGQEKNKSFAQRLFFGAERNILKTHLN